MSRCVVLSCLVLSCLSCVYFVFLTDICSLTLLLPLLLLQLRAFSLASPLAWPSCLVSTSTYTPNPFVVPLPYPFPALEDITATDYILLGWFLLYKSDRSSSRANESPLLLETKGNPDPDRPASSSCGELEVLSDIPKPHESTCRKTPFADKSPFFLFASFS